MRQIKAKDPDRTIRCGLSSNDPNVRGLAVQIALDAPDWWRVISERLGSPDPQIELGALNAIEKLHEKPKFKMVEKLLDTDISTLSLTAAETLVALDPIEARRTFENKLNSSNQAARLYSAAMLIVLDSRATSRTEER